MSMTGDPFYDAPTVGAAIGMDALGSGGVTSQDLPLAYDILAGLPSAWSTAGWNMRRTQNTIFSGGLSSSRAARVMRGGRGPSPDARARSRSTRRFSRAANIDHTAYGTPPKGVKGIYSPFNALAAAGNFTARNATRIPVIGNSLAEQMTKHGIDPARGALFSPGTLGRIAAMDKMHTMSDSRWGKQSRNVFNAIEDIRPGTMRGAGLYNPMNRFEGSFGMANTITGKISGQAAGFLEGSRAIRSGSREAVALARSRLTGPALEGAERAFARGADNALVKFAGSGAVGGALRGVSTAGTVLLVHDVAMLAGKVVGRGINAAMEAGRSAMGSIDRPIMGGGFRDNEVAATSRQRGVMAISNSRLNARSALGSEASAMAAHFG